MKIRREKLLFGAMIALIAIFFCALNVQARCTDQQLFELQEAGRRVRSSIEVIEAVEYHYVEYGESEFRLMPFPRYKFQIDTFNVTGNLFVTMVNRLTNENIVIHYDMTEGGAFAYLTDDLVNIVNYSFRVYSSVEGCFGHHLRSYTVRKPMLNPFAASWACEGLGDVPYCRTFLDSELNITEDELPDRIDRFLAGPNQGTDDENGVGEWIRNNTLIAVVIVIIISGVATALFFVNQKRRSI